MDVGTVQQDQPVAQAPEVQATRIITADRVRVLVTLAAIARQKDTTAGKPTLMVSQTAEAQAQAAQAETHLTGLAAHRAQAQLG